MVKNQTWIAILIFAALVGGMIWLNKEKETKEAEATPSAEEITLVFNAEEGIVSSVQIDTAAGETVSLEISPDNAWIVKMPIEGAAEPGQVGAAVSQISSLRNLGSVDAPLDVLGLDKPEYVITVKFTGGKTHKLAIGSITPTQNGYYAQLDDNQVFIINEDGIASLTPLVAAPPYLATPTPQPAIVPAITPTP